MQKDLKQLFGQAHGLDEKSVEFLTKALEKNNLPGFDYIEYKQSLGALMAMNMDEVTAFKSAYATAATVGLTKEKLIKTAEHYKSVLNSEKQKFDAALEKNMTERVKSKQEEVAKLKKQVEDYLAKIAEMQKKIEEYKSIIANADGDIRASIEKIESTKESFEFALKSIMNQIDKDIESINQYL
ncbi:MAG: hypothetical protein SFU99_23165 [Saprospiraceae bacterium]|nr:hypothetical protein [Saprospiraceae bacterium]